MSDDPDGPTLGWQPPTGAPPGSSDPPPPWTTPGLPASPPGGYPPPAYPAQPGYAPQGWGPGYGYAPPKTNGLAIASLVCALGAFVVCPLVAVVGLVLGIMARRQIRDSNGAETGDGLALAGIIIGAIGTALAVVGLVGVIVLVAVGASQGDQSLGLILT